MIIKSANKGCNDNEPSNLELKRLLGYDSVDTMLDTLDIWGNTISLKRYRSNRQLRQLTDRMITETLDVSTYELITLCKNKDYLLGVLKDTKDIK